MKILNKITLAIILSAVLFSGLIVINKGSPNVIKPVVAIEIPVGQRQQDNISYTGILENAKNVSELAKKDVISRFNLTDDIVRVEAIIPVEWTDTSLGFPEPGKEPGKDYEIKTIIGYTILIYAKDPSKGEKVGKLYEYHSDYNRIIRPSGPIE